METVIKKDIAGKVSTYHYSNETVATNGTLSSVTVKVHWPGGSELIASASITPDSDGKMSVTIPAASAANVDSYYRAHFQYTYDSTVYTQDVYFHVAPTDFDINFHNDNLLGLMPDINDYAPGSNTKFYRQREIAVADLYSRLLNDGYEPWRILNRSALEIPFGQLWMTHICRSISRGPGDDWHDRAEYYRELYEESFAAVNIIEADSDDANIADDEAVPIRTTRLRRA